MPSNLHPILMQAFEPLNSALNTYGKTSRFSINKQHTSYLTLYIYIHGIFEQTGSSSQMFFALNLSFEKEKVLN
jgi:hypothetical protein